MSAPDARVEVFYDDAWNQVSAQDLDSSRSDIRVTYGMQDSHSEAVPTDVALSLESPESEWGPADPRSPVYEKVGLGSPLRVRIGDPQVNLSVTGVEGAFASTPDTAVLDITGDIDVRVDVKPATWQPLELEILAAKVEGPFSWALYLLPAGALRFSWSTDGTAGTRVIATSTVDLPASTERLAVRATLDVNNGAAGNTVTFYTAPTIAGTWTQLGAAVVTAGVTSIFSSTVDLAVGAGSLGGTVFSNGNTLRGRIYAFELYNGIAGTRVAAADFTAQDPEHDEFTDDEGLVWTVWGQAALTDLSVRGSTEITKFVPSWDRTTRDARVAITALGVRRSLGVGEEPLRSALFRDLSTKDDVVAYWPMEDGSGAASLASGKTGHPAMTFDGAVSLAAYNGFVASQPIPTFSAPTAGASYATGTIPPYVGAADQRGIALVHVPAAGVVASERKVLEFGATGTAARWEVEVLPGVGELKVTAYNAAGTELFNSGTLAFAIAGQHVMVSLWLQQSGADINWQVATFNTDGTTGTAGSTLAANTYGRFTHGSVGPSFDLAGTAVGHLAVINDDVHSIWDLVGRSLVAWAAETPVERLERLTGEAGIELRVVGDPTDTELLGPQKTTGMMSILDAATEVGMGWYGERRDRPSLLYRTRADLYNQDPKLTLDMSTGAISNPFSPPLDDTQVRNDITVTRESGSSYRAVQETGPNNIQKRRNDPQGIGNRYTDTKTLNVYSDSQLPNQATWRLFLSTVAEHRISALEIEMHQHPELLQAVLELEGGDLIRITNPPVNLPPGPLDLIAVGWTDTITDDKWRVRIVCAPGSPWTVAAVSDGTDERRAHAAGSTVVSDFDAGTDTALTVATTTGLTRWTTNAADCPMQIVAAGVVLEVTAISSATPQVLTCDVTPVNGVIKTIPAGAEVHVARPMNVPL